jgi:signal transduction histidine kinase
LRRAGRVAGNARLFSRLANGQPIEVNAIPLSIEEVRLLLIEGAMDNMLVSEDSRGVTFGFEEESIARLSRESKVKVDKDLFDQALNDLLDNAGKYSDENSRVKIELGLSKAYFTVSVTNKGLRIAREEIPIIKRRGERGPVAKLAAGEGSGIGLWIVDEIMKAHGGTLEINPTTPDRLTRIRLLFPV